MAIKNIIFLHIMLVVLYSCSKHSNIIQGNLSYNRYFINWTYDSVNQVYLLNDYPSGVRKLYPFIKEYKLDLSNIAAKITGKLTYPSLNNAELPEISSAPIISVVPTNNKGQLRFKSNLGSTDGLGNFSITISDPPSRFFILFSKDNLLPVGVEFNIKK